MNNSYLQRQDWPLITLVTLCFVAWSINIGLLWGGYE